MSKNLDSFIVQSRPPPEPIAKSQEIRDRGSIFFASIYSAKNSVEAQACIRHQKQVLHAAKPATHEITAWRCMSLKPGKSGLGGPDDFTVRSANDDDGEKNGSRKILKVMENSAVLDAVVIVTRYYGGHMLGPARFTHIETCATEACALFKKREELDDCIASLRTLDDILATLREEFASLSVPSNTSDSSEPPSKPLASSSRKPQAPIYDSWTDADLPKARRLVTARENAIASVKALIAKHRKSQEERIGLEQ